VYAKILADENFNKAFKSTVLWHKMPYSNDCTLIVTAMRTSNLQPLNVYSRMQAVYRDYTYEG